MARGLQVVAPMRAAVTAMANAVHNATTLHVEGGRGTSGWRGTSLIIPAPQVADPGIIDCKATEALSFLELVEVVDGVISDLAAMAYGQQPSLDNLYRVGVAQADAAVDDVISVRIMGVGLVKYFWEGGSTVDAGSLLGSESTDTLAYENMSGPLQVIEIATHDTAWTGYNYALVKVGDSYGIPDVWKTTAAPGSGTVTAKRVNSSGVVQGNNFTFTVL